MIVQSTKAAQAMEVLRSPLRIELFMLLEAIGPSSVAELAAAMDRRADGLYHHLHKLERAGLVRVSGYRSVNGHEEALYARTELGGQMRPGPREAASFARMAQALAKHGVESLERSLESEGFHETGHRFRAETSWLTPDEIRTVGGYFDEILRIFEAARGRGRDGERMLAIMLLSPDMPRGRRHSESGDGAGAGGRAKKSLTGQKGRTNGTAATPEDGPDAGTGST